MTIIAVVLKEYSEYGEEKRIALHKSVARRRRTEMRKEPRSRHCEKKGNSAAPTDATIGREEEAFNDEKVRLSMRGESAKG